MRVQPRKLLCFVSILGIYSYNHCVAFTHAWTTPSQSKTVRMQQTDSVLLIDWDSGCVVDTSLWRINLAYEAASILWPELTTKIKAASKSSARSTATSQLERSSWLTNKLLAIAPALHEDTREFSPTAQYVLALRLLIEEQDLDEGKSPGSGKYGSLYHPQQYLKNDDNNSKTTEKVSSGSRPLTVNEVSTNWCEFLLDTLPIKYKVRPTELEEAIDQCMKHGSNIAQFSEELNINTATTSMLTALAAGHATLSGTNSKSRRQPGRSIPVITVRNKQDMTLAQNTLSEHLQDTQICINTIEDVRSLSSVDKSNGEPVIYVLYKNQNTIPKLMTERSSMVKDFIDDDSIVQNIQVVESSWKALQRDTMHANHPVIAEEGMRIAFFAWCQTPEMERRATMCAWSIPCPTVDDLRKELGFQYISFE